MANDKPKKSGGLGAVTTLLTLISAVAAAGVALTNHSGEAMPLFLILTGVAVFLVTARISFFIAGIYIRATQPSVFVGSSREDIFFQKFVAWKNPRLAALAGAAIATYFVTLAIGAAVYPERAQSMFADTAGENASSSGQEIANVKAELAEAPKTECSQESESTGCASSQEAIEPVQPVALDVGGEELQQRYTADFKSCLQRAGGVVADQLQCAADELRVQDQDLNRVYRTAMEQLNEDERASVQQAQRDWIRNRDSTCGAPPDETGGSLTSNIGCLLRLTTERVIELDGIGAAG